MSEVSRAEITNAIWLCRNCHKLIDSDEGRFTADLLFQWREIHEEHIFSELGSSSDRLIYERGARNAESFEGYPPVVKRIVMDRPVGWEWRLAAELLRSLNTPAFRRLDDLRSRLYAKALQAVDIKDFPSWLRLKLAQFQSLIPPFEGLLERLSLSFGKPGESGDASEIHYVCKLIRDYLDQVVLLEESLHFVHVPNECVGAVKLLQDLMGSQAMKLAEIPDALDEVAEMAKSDGIGFSEEPIVVRKTITLETPVNWSSAFSREMDKILKHIEDNGV